METNGITSSSGVTGGAGKKAAASELAGDDFFKLLIAQLTNQDPLEPTSNQDLLNQISSIREIELNTNLSESLKSMTTTQRFASAASMIGQYVTAKVDDGTGEGQVSVSGTVVGVWFDSAGRPMLELEDGTQISMEQVDSITSSQSAAEALVGRYVTGIDRSDPAHPRLVEGLVTGTTRDDNDRVLIELEDGQTLSLTDIVDSQLAEEMSVAE
jgi:flagellar basal-body rod modification protein FlgD